MSTAPRYITQIDADWLAKTTRMANATPGDGISMPAAGEEMKIEIDKSALVRMMWAALQQGIANVSDPANLISIVI